MTQDLSESKNGIFEISKNEAKYLVSKYHYLANKDFTFIYAYGLFIESECVGAAVFGMVGGISSLKGWFGIGNKKEESSGFVELNRLVLHPNYNGGNYTSKLLGGALRKLKKKGVRAVVSLADASIHNGYVYQACNFSYHGLSDNKTDFYQYLNNGDFKINPRGRTKELNGVWLPRTRKHRYVYLMDKRVNVLYKKEKYPKGQEHKSSCCNNS